MKPSLPRHETVIIRVVAEVGANKRQVAGRDRTRRYGMSAFDHGVQDQNDSDEGPPPRPAHQNVPGDSCSFRDSVSDFTR